jgi:hypothetical protein
LVLVVGRDQVTEYSGGSTKTMSLRQAWALDDFAAKLAAETAASVAVVDEVDPSLASDGTILICPPSVIKTLLAAGAGFHVRQHLVELGIAPLNGLAELEASSIGAGIDSLAYDSWRTHPDPRARLYGCIGVAKSMGAHCTIRSERYCSLWSDAFPTLPALTVGYLEQYADLFLTR